MIYVDVIVMFYYELNKVNYFIYKMLLYNIVNGLNRGVLVIGFV